MKITKYGHCCLLLEVFGLRVLTDPGIWSQGFRELTDINLILITHEHKDHLHIEGVQEILHNNPEAEVVTNASVGKILEENGIVYTLIEDKASITRDEVLVEAFAGAHSEIFQDFGLVENTGYLIDERFFYSGDSYTKIDKPVEILALPVAGPWCKSADALRFALEIKPKWVLPVHDAVLNDEGLKLVYGLFENQLKTKGIEFKPLKNFEASDF